MIETLITSESSQSADGCSSKIPCNNNEQEIWATPEEGQRWLKAQEELFSAVVKLHILYNNMVEMRKN